MTVAVRNNSARHDSDLWPASDARGVRSCRWCRVMEPASVHESFYPIYPNTLWSVPKPSRASRAASLVLTRLHAGTRWKGAGC